jgi:hypothetical protein
MSGLLVFSSEAISAVILWPQSPTELACVFAGFGDEGTRFFIPP